MIVINHKSMRPPDFILADIPKAPFKNLLGYAMKPHPIIALLLISCAPPKQPSHAPEPSPQHCTDGNATVPIVSVSAQGWTLQPGSPQKGLRPTTIVINPKGRAFNIGLTAYPDILPATLWIVEVKELHARFLMIRVPPAASAAVSMPLLFIDQNDVPHWAGSIRQRFEFQANAMDAPGGDPWVMWDGKNRIKDLLFQDADGDGIPELVEVDCWKEHCKTTYFKFTPSRTFIPLSPASSPASAE